MLPCLSSMRMITVLFLVRQHLSRWIHRSSSEKISSLSGWSSLIILTLPHNAVSFGWKLSVTLFEPPSSSKSLPCLAVHRIASSSKLTLKWFLSSHYFIELYTMSKLVYQQNLVCSLMFLNMKSYIKKTLFLFFEYKAIFHVYFF